MRPDLLPPGLVGETPQSILFIGKAVRVLTPANGDTMGDGLGAAAALDALQGAPAFDAAYFELVVEHIREQVTLLLPLCCSGVFWSMLREQMGSGPQSHWFWRAGRQEALAAGGGAGRDAPAPGSPAQLPPAGSRRLLAELPAGGKDPQP